VRLTLTINKLGI